MDFKILYLGVLLVVFYCKNPFEANKKEHNEDIAFLYNELKTKIDNIQKKNILLEKLTKNTTDLNNIKKKIEELVKFLQNTPNLLNSETDIQKNTFNLLHSLYKKVKDEVSDPMLKKLAPKLKSSIKKSSTKLQLKFENRKKFENFISQVSKSNPKILDILKELLIELPDVCLLKRDLNGNSILHELVNSRDLLKEGLDKNQKNELSPNNINIKQCINILLHHILTTKKYWKALKYQNHNGLTFLHYAARKNYVSQIFKIIPESKDYNINNIMGLNVNYINKENPLHYAFSSISKESAIEFLERAPHFLIQTDEKGYTPLHNIEITYNSDPDYPAFVFNKERIRKYEKQLIEALNILDNSKKTPLFNFIEKLKIPYNSKSLHPILNVLKFIKDAKNKYITDAQLYSNKKKMIKRKKIINLLLKKLRNSKEIIIKANGTQVYNEALKLLQNLN